MSNRQEQTKCLQYKSRDKKKLSIYIVYGLGSMAEILVELSLKIILEDHKNDLSLSTASWVTPGDPTNDIDNIHLRLRNINNSIRDLRN